MSISKLMDSEFWLGYLSAFAAWGFSFVAPIAPFLVFTIALVIADLITGLSAARKNAVPIHSRGLRRTTEKLTLYFIAILLAEGMKVVFFPAVPITYLVSGTIAVAEFKSNLENVEAVTGVNIWVTVWEKISKLK